jgi:hypothetical protein
MPYKVPSNAKFNNHGIENMFMREFIINSKKVHSRQHIHDNIRMSMP